MSLEQKINYQLNKLPIVKKAIKRVYQRSMYAISPKIKSEGNITRISPDDVNHEYFFGYYDKSPWDTTDRYMLCLKANDTWSDVSPKEEAEILLIDTERAESDQERVKVIAKTRAWNVQQSCMLQWLGPDYSSKILYNDFRDGRYCSVILDVVSGNEKVIPAAVYSVSLDGTFALTLDFSRLYNLRPGYGYYNEKEATEGVALPDTTAIWKVDLVNREVSPVIKYNDFINFEPRPEMKEKGSVHKVNHIMLSPNGKRFMVLYRWFNGQRKYTRLVTCSVDGSDMYVLSDDDMVSHCIWKNNNEILAFENKKDGGPGYYLMKDKTQKYIHCWPQVTNDGHPSYSPDGSLIVTDSYPDRARVASINLMDGDEKKKENTTIARVFAPFKYDNDTRCDLHPRWNHAGNMICFDSTFEGHRGLYIVEVKNERVMGDDIGTQKIKVAYVFTSCKRSGPVQIMLYLVSKIDRNTFEPVLFTLYDEIDGESQLKDFLDLGVKHIKCPVGKKDILLGRTNNLLDALKKERPDLIHSMGVFPDYAISRMKYSIQVITLHNYMHEDYIAKYGKLKGTLLVYMQSYAVKHADRVLTCSQSLASMYSEKKGLNYSFVRNGVDVNKYSPVSNDVEKSKLRNKLGLPQNKIIFITTGQFIDRKDQSFMLNCFSTYTEMQDYILLMLGDGVNLPGLKTKYGNNSNFIFTGNVVNVEEYLKASDYYVSSSHSEGLPTSVLEAMGCGLPVILSDIEQHKEIVYVADGFGVIYHLGDKEDFVNGISNILKWDYKIAIQKSSEVAFNYFSSVRMAGEYQREYLSVIEELQ